MIPHVPDQRKSKAAGNSFGALVKYITQDGKTISPEPRQQPGVAALPEFSALIDYATAPSSKSGDGEKCIAVRTHGVQDLSTAALEMHAVAQKNPRVADPAYHIILSWPEHEHPAPDKIFDAAEHALKALGMSEHQYVLAVHGDTDNTHCHISVNRVHPVTFKSTHIEWATKTLHMAARQSEIKHGWSHDNGIYVVEIDGQGKKRIVLNKDQSKSVGGDPRVHREFGTEEILPTWHDPEGLDSWLKKSVAKSLKGALPKLDGWPALHAWLDRYDIRLSDTGGGFRLHATSPETGEVIDLAASKGLRMLKRSDLESRWGKFISPVSISALTPDLSHLSPKDIQKGIKNVLTNSPDGGRPPKHIRDRNPTVGRSPEHVLRAEQPSPRDASDGSGRVHELSDGGMAGDGQTSAGVLPGALHDGVGDLAAGQDPDLRRPGASEAGSGSQGLRSRARDESRRAERKEQRAAARVDVRARFAQYKRFVRIGDTEHFTRLKEARDERSAALKAIRDELKAAKTAMRKTLAPEHRLIAVLAIDAESARRRVLAHANFQDKQQALQATRTPPLSWRSWLYEQSNLGDQAALSALRGIVYQAQRDAKKNHVDEIDDTSAAPETNEYREHQYLKAMARLLKEEKDEIAIRSASYAAMRPHEVDSLIANYKAIQWRVTGNGNVEYSDLVGHHLFTDRGNRITFDRVKVSDEDIRLALAHAQQKFGSQLTLSGDSRQFTERMARLADDMGLTVLNPELREVVHSNRARRVLRITEAPLEITPAPEPVVAVSTPLSPQDALRKRILAIDPNAKFVVPAPAEADSYHVGPLAAREPGIGFAQHAGRNLYVLHAIDSPDHLAGDTVAVRYRNGIATAVVVPTKKREPDFAPIAPAPAPAPAPIVQSGASEPTVPTVIPAEQFESAERLSANAWLRGWSAASGKPFIPAVGESTGVAYNVLYVAEDGVVIDKGRALVLYPVENVLGFTAGDKVIVTPGAQLRVVSLENVPSGKAER